MGPSRVDRIETAAAKLSLPELHDLAARIEALIFFAEQPPERNPKREVIEERKTPTGTLRLELVNCGKDRCKRCRGGPAHGPYWYAYWKQDGHTRSKYIGKQLPAEQEGAR
jgi:hypothetical protein